MTPRPDRIGLVENLAEAIGGRASAQSVYGSPIVRDEITVIPVAKFRYGLGGGSGVREGEEGSGGGGGAMMTPIGYIEIREGKSRFRRINSPLIALQIIGGLAFGAWLTLRGLRGYRRA